MEELSPEEEKEIRASFAQTYGVELFFDEKPDIGNERLLPKLQKYCGNVKMGTRKAYSKSYLYFHLDHQVKYKDGQAPAQFLLAFADKGKEKQGNYTSSYGQSWRWRDAQAKIDKCSYTILATDLMSSSLNYKQRLELFRNSLRAVLETVDCRGIHWTRTQQFIKPTDYLASFSDVDVDELYGAINVRLFNIQDSDETLMDTLGLAAVGLPDIQCHFRGLNVSKVADVLYSLAYYIYEHGDIIEDGHTVQGIEPSDKWMCHHEFSLIDPKRVVLDINPGSPNAGGNRT